MSTETVARRYSAALADVVLQTGDVDTVKAELAGWHQIFDENPDLTNVFSNPAISHVNKEKLLEELLAKSQPSKTTANFLRILLRNDRINEIGEIHNRFASVLEERKGVVSAEITSARELPESERAAFQANLEKLTGKKVNIKFVTNSDIIGGVVTRIGSTVYDGSVRTKLDSLKEQLIGG
ncbi:MAG: F0F1 ATP synthase subunit delta [Pyrinomonadaceae bacterium]|nr:F0F1 ATP synthase subunit delta [Pyrinomonadaceae bacterium]